MYTPKRQSVSRDKARTPHGYSSPFAEERSAKRFSTKRFVFKIFHVEELFLIDLLGV